MVDIVYSLWVLDSFLCRICWFVRRLFSAAAISDKVDGLPVVATSGAADDGIISSLLGLTSNAAASCPSLNLSLPFYCLFSSCFPQIEVAKFYWQHTHSTQLPVFHTNSLLRDLPWPCGRTWTARSPRPSRAGGQERIVDRPVGSLATVTYASVHPPTHALSDIALVLRSAGSTCPVFRRSVHRCSSRLVYSTPHS